MFTVSERTSLARCTARQRGATADEGRGGGKRTTRAVFAVTQMVKQDLPAVDRELHFTAVAPAREVGQFVRRGHRRKGGWRAGTTWTNSAPLCTVSRLDGQTQRARRREKFGY